MMFSKIAKHFSYANIAMTMALVFAMTGGAYAAGKYLITSTKQISPSVFKSLKGKVGVAGPAGPAGLPGPAGQAGGAGPKGETGSAGKDGAPGEKGLPGEKGASGTNGFNGTNGVSVTSKAVLTGEPACNKEGGSEFTAASNSKTFACNGKEGSAWTAGGTLPVGSSETGQWTFVVHFVGSKAPAGVTSMSFPIGLAKALSPADTHLIKPEEGEGEPKAKLPTGCSGNFKAPKAESGNFCVFTQQVLDISKFSFLGMSGEILDAETGEEEAGRSGAILTASVLGLSENEEAIATGDWVVTG